VTGMYVVAPLSMELNRSVSQAVILTALIAAACDTPNQSIAPTAPSLSASPPANAPPAIRSLSTNAPRVEADDTLTVVAEVDDAETPVDQLVYEWSASPMPGRFSGSGRQVKWTAPRGQRSPDTYRLTLTVTEHVSSPAPKDNTTTSSVEVHYNDSHPEMTQLALDFLGDSANDNITPAQCVRNFSDGCAGKQQQLSAIQAMRQNYRMLGGDFSIDHTELWENRSVGDVFALCTFRRISKITGQTETVTGVCTMTTVYENWRWLLCESRFDEGSTAATARARPR